MCGEQTCSSTCINNSLCKNCSGRLRMRTASLNNVALGGGNVRQRVLFSPLTSKGQSTPLASVKAQIQKFDRKRKSSCPGRFRGMEVKWTFQMSEIPEMWTVHRMNRSLSAPTLDRPSCTPYTIPLFGFRLTREFIFEEVENRIYKSIVMVFLVFSTQILNGKKKGKNQVTPINRFAASKNLNFASPIGREIRILPARKAIHLLQSSLCRPRTEVLWGRDFPCIWFVILSVIAPKVSQTIVNEYFCNQIMLPHPASHQLG